MNCATCGKKLGLLESGTPIQDKPPLDQYKMCVTCWNTAVRINEDRAVEGDVDYFTRLFDEGYGDAPVLEFMRSLIGDKSTEMDCADDLIITSGCSIEGYRISEYLEFIEYQTAMGMGYFKTFDASVASLTGEAATGFQEKISVCNKAVIQGLTRRAAKMKADGIIGMTLNHAMFATNLVGIVATGTAVKIEKM